MALPDPGVESGSPALEEYYLPTELSGKPEQREVKDKEKTERYTYVYAESQRITRKDKEAFLNDQCKEIEENNRMRKTKISSRKLEIPREHFMQRWAHFWTEMVWT